MDNEASYTNIKIYNKALIKEIETIDEAQLADVNKEMCNNDNKDKEQKKILILNRRHMLNTKDNTIIRHKAFKCSYISEYKTQKVILEENRRNQDSNMVGCS
ncbi:7967_t:CDS:2 [Cetraspora pellucida]|uniref:7967_t:CDS:1 n=1 Tax=Cetraspora pellucida TaxID=1433469 RepID=A0A9N8VL92_9GLOM|nr:7967_t:CDS:2 [Cetraspora pellucida]